MLHAFLTQSRDCIKLINTAGELEYLNANGVEALGFTDASDVVGKHWRELWPEESHAQIDASIHAALDGRPTEFEAWCPNRHGEDRWWDVSVSPVAAEGGQITHMIAISRDVTAQVKLREVETLRREAAEHQADFAGSIAGEMRHRFKNQLAVIGAIAKLLARHTDNASELARKLDEKLLALALAQDLLTESNDAPIPADIAIVKVLTASGMGAGFACCRALMSVWATKRFSNWRCCWANCRPMRSNTGRCDRRGVVSNFLASCGRAS